MNRDIFTVYADTTRLERGRENEIADALAGVFSVPAEYIKERLKKENDPYEVLASNVSEETAGIVRGFAFPGIGLERASGRYYPLEGLGSHLVGFLGVRGDKKTGQYGLEGFYNDELGAEGGAVNELVLSVDPQIQFKIEQVLEATLKRWESPSGSVIVMEPATGRILGMANYPAFNPNTYNEEEDISVFTNQAISGQFELGSVFKPITMAAALNEGAVTPETRYKDAGFVTISGYTIRNFDGRSHGEPTMTEVLERSLNTGAMFAQQAISKDAFRKYVSAFGFGERTGIDLQGETRGNLSNLRRDKDLEFANASFGQGISVTPLQMLSAVAAVANKGVLVRPHVVDERVYRDGLDEPVGISRMGEVVAPETAEKLTKMLVSTVENGYDKAKVPGYFVAGKTGTAQIPDAEQGGYSEETIHSFVGYAPAYRPRFAVLVKMDRPQGVRFASSSLAPVFADIMSYLLTYYEVPPDL